MNDYGWDDLALGMNAQFEVEVTPELMTAFANLSGDVNPLHMDDRFAQACGFPGRVAFGMLTSSFYSRLVGVHLPGKRALLDGIDLEFKSPAYVGDRLTVSGEIAFLNDTYHRCEIKARIRNSAGKLISKATIRVGVR
jgi:3-hydroxybutyryl-CoA dehydratase